MLLEKYLREEVLQTAYDDVARAKQNDRENEDDFFTRLNDAWGVCPFAFDASEVANYYLRGCRESVREQVHTQLKQLPFEQRSDPEEVRRLAVSAGKVQRSLAKSLASAASSRHAPKSSKGARVLHVGDVVGHDALPSPPTTPSTYSASTTLAGHIQERLKDPTSVLQVNLGLDSVLAITETQVRDVMEKTGLEFPSLFKAVTEVPDLTNEQLAQALKVIPQDYWMLQCWSCRESGHSTFGCPLLTLSQRVYFAYAYYCHQVRCNPAMATWYDQKERQTRGEDINPGPKPSNAGARGMGGIRGGRGRGGRWIGDRQGSAANVVPEKKPVQVIMDDTGNSTASSEKE